MGLEGFVDLTDPTAREPAEEGEATCLALLLDSPHGCASEL